MKLEKYELVKRIIQERYVELKTQIVQNLKLFTKYFGNEETSKIFFIGITNWIKEDKLDKVKEGFFEIQEIIENFEKEHPEMHILHNFEMIKFQLSLIDLDNQRAKLKDEIFELNQDKPFFNNELLKTNEKFKKNLEILVDYNIAFIISNKKSENIDFFKEYDLYDDYIVVETEINKIAHKIKFNEYEQEIREYLYLMNKMDLDYNIDKKIIKKELQSKENKIKEDLRKNYFTHKNLDSILLILFPIIYLGIMVIIYFVFDKNYIYSPWQGFIPAPILLLNILYLKFYYVSKVETIFWSILAIYLFLIFCFTLNGSLVMYVGFIPIFLNLFLKYFYKLSIKGKLIQYLSIMDNSSEFLNENPSMKGFIKTNFNKLIRTINFFLSQNGYKMIGNIKHLEAKFQKNLHNQKYRNKKWLKYFTNNEKIFFLTNLVQSKYYYILPMKILFNEKNRIYNKEIDGHLNQIFRYVEKLSDKLELSKKNRFKLFIEKTLPYWGVFFPSIWKIVVYYF